MDISEACRVVRRCRDTIESCRIPDECDGVALAVFTLKQFLERARGGRAVDELLITESVLLTPQGIRWVMRFVDEAEALLAIDGRR